MSKQKTLLNFFNKVSKRQISTLEDSLNEKVCKKSKFDTDEKESINDKDSQKNNTNENEISKSKDAVDQKNNKDNDSKIDSEIISQALSKNQEQSNIKCDDNLTINDNVSLKYDKEIKNEIIQKINSEEYCRNENKINSKDEMSKSVEENKSNSADQIFVKIRTMADKYSALQPNIGESWFRALAGEFVKPYFHQLSTFLQQERKKATIYPPLHQVWTWTRIFKISEVRVVILGQDPYHNTGQAHGLCFSVPRGIPPPPSLLNMYKELEKDIENFKRPSHGNLIGWARQGVLLLNACLTVRAHEANSHRDKGWELLTDAVIQTISNKNTGVVFLLWGSYAQKKASNVNKKKHHLLKAPHPSPLSAHRGFFGCKHFSICNELLKKQGKVPIDWSNLPLE